MTSLSWHILRDRWPRTHGNENCGIKSVYERVTNSEFNLTPEYQRSYIWTDRQASLFVGFLMEGGTPPSVWIQRWADTNIPDEILDGVQRLNSLCRFYKNEIPMITADNEIAYLQDFEERDRSRLVSTAAGPNISIQYVSFDTKKEVIEMYLRLNRGGTPHSEEEIERVRNLLAK